MKKISLENSNGILTRQVDVDDATSHLTVYDNTDTAIIDIEAHSSRHADSGEDPLPDASISTSMLQDGAVTNTKIADATIESTKLAAFNHICNLSFSASVGVSGSPAQIINVSLSPGYHMFIPLTVICTPAGVGTSESITFTVKATCSDGTTAALGQKSSAAGSTAAVTFTMNDFNFKDVPNNTRITEIIVDAESSATATSATATAQVVALELYT